jgi:predicted membrane chloride channel (bestrophin family)
MVTDVMNASQYARIVPSNEFTEELHDWVGTQNIDREKDEDKLDEYDTINLNSKMLKELIN